MRKLTLLLAFAVIASACGDAAGGVPTIDIGPDQVVLRVDSAGGLIPLEFSLSDMPEFLLTGDGRAITVGPQIAVFPGPALPSLLVTRLTPAGVAEIVNEAVQAGLSDPLLDYGFPGVTDMPTTTFTLRSGHRQTVAAVYALGFDEVFGDESFGVTARQSEARRRLSRFQDRLFDLEGWMGDEVIGDPEPYPIDRLAVYLATGEEGFFPGDSELKPLVMDWPLGTATGAIPSAPPYECLVVKGDELASLLPAIGQADQTTRWVIDGVQHHAIFRPLLPGEAGCVPAR